ncbi:MAG: tyrosine-type recombinase/integrase [Acidimicrobiales bacterium]
MPKYDGVYQDSKGRWYFKVWLGRDPLSGRQSQVTKRGFPTAAEAARARREYLDDVDRGHRTPQAPASLMVNDLLDAYLDGIDADGRLSAKTRFDYRTNADAYVRPWLGNKRVRDLTPEVILAWQRQLTKAGGTKKGKALSANTVRLARAPLAGALKLAVEQGVLRSSPIASVKRPRPERKVPRHWSPDQTRQFLRSQEGDRLYPLWAFLLGSGLRIGELVWLRWDNVDLERQHARVIEFATTLGWDLVESVGKSATAIRTVDLDDGLVAVLEQQRDTQRFEALHAGYVASDYVFTKPQGGPYHPQTLSKALARLSQRAGLPRLTAHGLRHTSATLMLDSGVPPKVAAERLGHADATLFTNLYSHVTPTMQREAADRLGAALFGGGDGGVPDARRRPRRSGG